MRFCWLLALLVVLRANLLIAEPLPQPIRDPQALALLDQAVNAAGGIAAISAIQDYTATGNVAFQLDQLSTGSATLTGRGSDFRLDASLQNGMKSWFILKNQGVKRDVDGTVSGLEYQQVASIETFNFPVIQVANAFTDSSVNVSYLGTTVRVGHQVVGVHIRTLSLPYFATDVRVQLVDKDFYFDATTFQIITVEDYAFPSDQIMNGVRHQVQFSNYQLVQGIMVPFSIADSIGNQAFTAFTLNQVSFNAGYTDSQFQP